MNSRTSDVGLWAWVVTWGAHFRASQPGLAWASQAKRDPPTLNEYSLLSS